MLGPQQGDEWSLWSPRSPGCWREPTCRLLHKSPLQTSSCLAYCPPLPALPAWASPSQLPSPPLPLPQAFCPAVLAPSCLAGLLAEAPGSCRRSSRAPRGPQGKVVWGTRLFVPASRGGIIPYCGETGHPCRGHLSPGGWGEDGGASAEVGVGEQGGRSCHHHLGDKKGHSPPILSPPREEQFW